MSGHLLIFRPRSCTLVLFIITHPSYTVHMGVSENRGTLFWGPYNEDPTL